MDTEKGTKKENKKDLSSEETDEMIQTNFQKAQKQYEKKRKRIPWELLLIIAAVLMSIYHFIGE